MKWTFRRCAEHWDGRRQSNNYRSIASCGWNRSREYMEWNKIDKCFDLTLHNTVVVRVFQNKFQINCGGWWTQLTRKKIHEWCGVHLSSCYPRKKYVENEFVWSGGKMVSVYYNHMEFNNDGEPLKPLNPTGYKLIKGSTKEFNDLAKRVRNKIMPRVLIGEFEEMTGRKLEESEVYDLLEYVDEHRDEYLSTDELEPLFRCRPKMSFGRQRQPWHRHSDANERTALQCLHANIAAARRYWMSDTRHKHFYTTVPKEFDAN
jgi:hypothetical protein